VQGVLGALAPSDRKPTPEHALEEVEHVRFVVHDEQAGFHGISMGRTKMRTADAGLRCPMLERNAPAGKLTSIQALGFLQESV
jgi:hypothetical protein